MPSSLTVCSQQALGRANGILLRLSVSQTEHKPLYTLPSLGYPIAIENGLMYSLSPHALGSGLCRVKQMLAVKMRDHFLLLPPIPSLEKVPTSRSDQCSTSVMFLSQCLLRTDYKPTYVLYMHASCNSLRSTQWCADAPSRVNTKAEVGWMLPGMRLQ